MLNKGTRIKFLKTVANNKHWLFKQIVRTLARPLNRETNKMTSPEKLCLPS